MGIGLKELPDELWELEQLTSLNLYGNQLTAVPEAFFGLINLTILDLSGNQLTAVPETISSLTKLTELDLSDNRLTALPQAISGLINHLTKLNYDGNPLTEVPEGISRIPPVELGIVVHEDSPSRIPRNDDRAPSEERKTPLALGPAEKSPYPAISRLAFAGFSNDNARALADSLGISQDVNALASVLAAKDVDPPLSIGLFGDWGSGKTFFMDLLERRIEDLAEASTAAGKRKGSSAYCSKIIQIRFNAWHYVDANLWASLVTHIFDELNAKLIEKPAKVDAGKLVADLQSTKDQIAEVEAKKSAITASIDVVTGELRVATKRRKKAKVKLEAVRKAVVASVSDDPAIKEDLQRLEKDLGLDSGKLAVAELGAELATLRTLAGRIRSLWRSPPSPMKIQLMVGVALLTLGGPLVILILRDKLDLARGQAIVASAVPVIAGLWRAWIVIRRYAERVVARIEDTREKATAVEDDLRRKSSVEEDALTQRISLKKAEEDSLGRQKQELEKQKATVERDLEAIRQGRSFKRYVLERNADDNYRKQLGLVAMIHRDFKVLSERLQDPKDEPHVERIVLYVDDLDRCPADQVVAVLQAVHLMLSFRLFVVVVGVDSRWLLHSLEEHYAAQLSTPRHGATPGSKDTTLANTPHNYLEKIFQIPFTMSPMKKDGFGSLIDSLVSPPVKPIVAPNPAPPVKPIDAPAPAPPAKDDGDVAKFEAAPAPSPDKIPVDRGSAVKPPSKVAPPGSGIADDELAPANLMISAEEIAFMKDNLDSTIGSPRAAKRFLNIYRILRASPGGGHSELKDDVSRDRYYRLLQIFLSVIIGHPICAGQLFQDILATNGLKDSKALLTYLEVRAKAGRAEEDYFWDDLQNMFKKHKGELTDWQEVRSAVCSTARFSFHTGRALAAARRSDRSAAPVHGPSDPDNSAEFDETP